MIALPVALLMVMALAGLGWPLAKRLGSALEPQERLALAPLLGALPLAILIQAVGYWRYDITSMALLMALGLVMAWRFPWRSLSGPDWGNRWLWLFALIMTGMAVSALAPPIDHDTIRYHLTLPRRDLEMGQIRVWFGWSIYEFFPPLASLLTRMAFALGGAEAAQMLNVAWVALAAVWAGLLTRRLGGGGSAPVVAALVFVGQRVVLNLGPAVTTDIPLAAYVGAAMLVAWAGRQELSLRLAVLLGLLLGAAMACKHHGMIAALILLTVLCVWRIRQPRHWGAVILAGTVSLAIIAPVLLRNLAITGNPFFPNAHPLFGADNLDIFAPFIQALASRTHIPGGLMGLPVSMFIWQDAFDGLQFGYPFMLLGLPFAFFRERSARLFALLAVTAYVAAWWFAMPHLLRFLQPMFIPLSALTAAGLVEAGMAFAALGRWRHLFTVIMVMGIAIQSLFAGSSLLYRIPVALGLRDIRPALEAPAFRNYSLISPCLWLQDNLRPGQFYLAMVNDPSYFCPQASAFHPLLKGEAADFYTRRGVTPLKAEDVAKLLRQENVRYILASRNFGVDDEPYVFAKHRFDALIHPILSETKPLLDTPSGSIYAADQVIAALEQASAQPPRQAGP